MFCIWSRAKFNRIDVLKLFSLRLHFLESINSLLLVHGPLARKMSQDRYASLWTFQSIFFSLCLCHCCCLFVSFLKQKTQDEISRIRKRKRGRNMWNRCGRLTLVSAVGLVTFTRVSVAAVTAEPYHFFTCFRQVSVEGHKGFRKRNFMFTWAETLGNVPEI